jgi:ubiquinone/menaquinone biosynthesis C-methylase UbiE
MSTRPIDDPRSGTRCPSTAAPARLLRIPVLDRQLGSWHFALDRDALPSAALRRRYDDRAPTYSMLVHRLGYARTYLRLAQQLVERGGPCAGARVLDCGAGSGALGLALARACGADLRLDLLDVSSAMLRAATSALGAHGIAVRAMQADVRRIPQRDCTYDVVMAAHVIEHLADPLPALREMHRVARTGARALLVMTRRSALGALIHLRWRVHCASEPQWCDWLESAGWRDVQFLPLEGPVWCARMSVACIAVKR